MLSSNPRLDALARDLEDLATLGALPEPPELADARDAVRQAADALSHDSRAGLAGPYSERALTLARMALDRARQALGATAGPRASWQEAVRPPVAAPDSADERRRPVTSSRHADVQLDSEIPEAHPAKSAIEASVAGAFAGVKGRWRVAILVQPNASWWGIRVEGGSVCWTGTLEGPEEQSPDFLGGRVREAVRLGLMQAALPRPPRSRS
jgi:hypothetical protein